MAGIKVFGHPASTATRRVLIALHEKDLDFELVHVELKDGEHKKEPFLSRNPFGKIPAFEDGDFKLFESRAITQYIAHEYSDKGNQLLSLGTKNMAILAMGMEIEAHEFDSVASKLGWEQIFKHFFGLTTDQSVVEEEEVKLAKVLDNYEARLGESKYLACDHFTLVDLHHVNLTQHLPKENDLGSWQIRKPKHKLQSTTNNGISSGEIQSRGTESTISRKDTHNRFRILESSENI